MNIHLYFHRNSGILKQIASILLMNMHLYFYRKSRILQQTKLNITPVIFINGFITLTVVCRNYSGGIKHDSLSCQFSCAPYCLLKNFRYLMHYLNREIHRQKWLPVSNVVYRCQSHLIFN